MNNQEAVVEQIIQNLAFEVEAVPNNISKSTSISQCMPLNVKIRVRKKDEMYTPQHYVSPASGEIQKVPEKVRLVSSDQTIMTFDVFMEAEFEKPSQKSRKHVLDILRPGICLGDNNDDDNDNSDMPSSSYSANVTERSVTTRSDGKLKHNFTLSKNIYQDYTVATQTKGQKWIFGRCKPGGCLDPPFSEDKYSYKPKEEHKEKIPDEDTVKENDNFSVKSSIPTDGDKDRVKEKDKGCKKPGKPTNGDKDIVKEKDNVCIKPRKSTDDDIKSNGKPSIFDSGLFKKKKTIKDKATNTKTVDDETNITDSILSIYPVDSSVNSLCTRSNSIITYPPNFSSDIRISEDKSVKSRGTSEDKSRKSFNEHSEPCFIPPKGINRIKEKDTVYQKDNQQYRLPNVSDAGNKTKDSFKMPITIPIPIPIPFTTNQRNPECVTTTGGIVIDITQDYKIIADKDSQDSINENNSKTPDQKVSAELTTSDMNNNVKKTLEKLTPDSINISSSKQDTTKPHTESINVENYNKKLRERMSQSDMVAINKNKDIEIPKEKNKADLLIKSIPNPNNISSNKPDRHNNVALNKNINNIEECDIKTIQSEQSFKHEIISYTIQNNEDSKDTVTGKIPRESESTLTALAPRLEDSKVNITKTDSISKNSLHNDSVYQERVHTESEIYLANLSTQEGDKIKPESKKEDIAEEIVHNKNKTEKKEEVKSIKLVDESSREYLENKSDEHKMIPDIKSIGIKDNENKNQKVKPVLIASKTSEPSIDKIDMSHSVPDTEKDECNGINSSIHSDNGSITESPKKQKKNYEDNVYTYDDGLKNINNNNVITAPVIIDEIEHSSYFRPVKEVYSETNLLNEQKVKDHSSYQSQSISKSQTPSSFKIYDDDNITQSSQELIEIKSVIHDMDDFFPSTSSKTRINSLDKQVQLPSNAGKGNSDIISSKIYAEIKGPTDDDIRNKPLKNKTRSTASVLSRITSTNTLKSALKKDIFSVELGFQSYLNEKNERILKTFDATSEPEPRFPNDSVTVIKSQIKISSNEIRLPIDSDHDMSIQIKKPANQRVSISESGFIDKLDSNRKIKPKSPIQTSGGEINPEAKGCDEIVEGDITDVNVLDLYEHELVPLQMIIKKLRDEIDVLAAQQMLYRDKIFCPKKPKLPRLVHSNRKCFGCPRK